MKKTNKIKKFRLYVGKKDIQNGIRYEEASCPIALALKRKFKTDNVEVYGPSEIIIDNVYYYDDDAVGKFISNFDRRLTVKPTKFTIKSTE